MKSTVDSVIQTFSKKKDSGEKQMRDCWLLFVPRKMRIYNGSGFQVHFI